MVQTRAKSARIQSQRSLSHELNLKSPSLLNKPLEVGVPTTSGFKDDEKTKKKLEFMLNKIFRSNRNLIMGTQIKQLSLKAKKSHL